MELLEKLKKIKESAAKGIDDAENEKMLDGLRIKYLGRKSELTRVLRSLKDLSVEDRRKIGPLAQQLKKELEKKIKQKSKLFTSQFSPPAFQFIDITKPGKRISTGHLHILSKTEEEIRKIFLSMNFSAIEGPEIEDEWHNFDALNIPADHPARDMWDTFWLKTQIDADKDADKRRYGKNISENLRKNQRKSALLLRTHTSPAQIHYMESRNPPFQIISPGRVFRYEATDASHEINFHQVEGLMVGRDVSLANFKFVVEEFFKKFFKGQKIEFRFVPSYFPFVEPGVQVDIRLNSSWLEVMGAGMVHRKVFEAVRYNPNEWQGFAFGVGLERLAMLKHKIPDIRLFYAGDLKFVKQF